MAEHIEYNGNFSGSQIDTLLAKIQSSQVFTTEEKTKLASLVNYDDTEVKEDISGIETSLNSHKSDKANPHEVTKAQVGLGNVDNVATKDVLANLVDAGAKNILDLSQPETVRDTVYSSLADGGVNLSCSNKVWTQYAVVVPVTSGKGYTFTMEIANVNGDLSSGYIFVRDENNNNYFDIRITAAGEYVKTFTATTNTVRVLVFLNNSATAKTVSLDTYGMLCTAEDYAISPEFVPHRPRYDELVARIEALEKAGE